MDVKKQIVQNYFLYDTHVENLFISEYLPSAPEKALKVYLLGLMHAEQGRPLDPQSMARRLGMSLDDVSEAWEHWQKQGLVRRTIRSRENPGDYSIEFLNIREIAFGRRPESAAVSSPETNFALDDEEFSRLLSEIEKETGRLLEAREPEEVASWISEYGIQPEVILLGYKYCTRRGKSNRCRYVGTVIKDWRAKGLESAAQVEDSLAADDKHYVLYRAVMKELGFARNATEPEKRLIDSWVDKMGFSLDEIKEAVKKTTGISNPNINYVNTILVSRYNEKNGAVEVVTNDNLFAKVNALYEKTREENAKKTSENREEIFTRIPRIKSILEEMRQCGSEISKAMLRGAAGTEQIGKLRAKSEALGREKTRLLVQNGYREDALDAIYDCKKCRDTGVLDDGSRCPCFNEKAEMLLKTNGR